MSWDHRLGLPLATDTTDNPFNFRTSWDWDLPRGSLARNIALQEGGLNVQKYKIQKARFSSSVKSWVPVGLVPN